eukprot:TRINITY_DN84_c2_g1_i1.p1 TRINITY_DN84_c2_g1~~TRINITY_DN84_c2_g1_i1.p1  ORF type:complete len:287 (+),score=94.62 TRINITY_DN84_c2_g1_i1:233-1093(+)
MPVTYAAAAERHAAMGVVKPPGSPRCLPPPTAAAAAAGGGAPTAAGRCVMAQCAFCRIRASNLMLREPAGSKRCSQQEFQDAITPKEAAAADSPIAARVTAAAAPDSPSAFAAHAPCTPPASAAPPPLVVRTPTTPSKQRELRCSGKDGKCKVKFTRGSVFKSVEDEDVALCARCFQSFDYAQHQFVHCTLDRHIPADKCTTPPTLHQTPKVRSDLLAQLLCRATVPHLIQHMQRAHKSQKTARCTLCHSPQKFTAREMVEHLRQHHLPPAPAAAGPPAAPMHPSC